MNEISVINDSFKIIQNSFRTTIFISMLVSVLFLAARPAADPLLLNKEINYLTKINSKLGLLEVNNIVANEIGDNISNLLKPRLDKLNSQFSKLLPHWKGKVILQHDFAVLKPNPWRDDLTKTLNFWQFFYNNNYSIKSNIAMKFFK